MRAVEVLETGSTVRRAICKIGELWALADTDLSQLLHGGVTTRELLELHRGLSAMFPTAADQILWLTTPHPAFGEPPIELAKRSPEGVARLVGYVETVRRL